MVIKMKLAEALQERADLNRRIEQLNSRLYRNSKVQQGRNPEEDPAELISELDGCIARLEYLIAKINICNCNTKTPDGKSITELIAKRDCLKIKIDAYRDLAGNAKEVGAYFMDKLKNLPHVKEVRGMGLMIGVEFDDTIGAVDVKHGAFDRKLLITAIGSPVIRMVPPLIASREDCDNAYAILEETVNALSK